MRTSAVAPYQRWNWNGDNIVQQPTIPAARTIPGTQKSRYPIDIRQFLSTSNNEVVRQELERLTRSLSVEEQAAFRSRAPGSFDLRARVIERHIGKLKYKKGRRKFDAWMFPEETLALGGGDCEDLAFLLCALLLASGISGYALRVALGSMIHRRGKSTRSWDHAWVVYNTEGGAWQILEPMSLVERRGRRAPSKGYTAPLDIEYRPHFVFNRDHLWSVRGPDERANSKFSDYLESRKFWAGFDPTFGAGVHNSIFDDALKGMSATDLAIVKAASLAIDANVLGYDPRDHFDFAYVKSGWQRVRARLRSKSTYDFGLAAHAIADFYAHSLYGEFGKTRKDGSLLPFTAVTNLARRPRYDFSSADMPGCKRTRAQAEAHWEGKLISGQWWRAFTTFPNSLEREPGFNFRRCLPDHDELAVDGPLPKRAHHRYDLGTFQTQFALRRAVAVEHIKKEYLAWKR